jgi:hypothetical protein
MRAANDWESKARKGKQLWPIQAIAAVFVSFSVCVNVGDAASGFPLKMWCRLKTCRARSR